VKERLLHAHFEEGRSVFDVGSLAALAGEAGLDDAEVRAALGDHRYRPAVLDDIRTAREPGATGVPFFVVDRRYGASGAQPADLLLQLLERARADADAVAS
jgi:predicted DsbA family dithiol-disulfide isomerase